MGLSALVPLLLAAPHIVAPADGMADAGSVGFLSINALPWATVSVDGVGKGTTPLPPLPLPPGSHRVELLNEKLLVRQTLTVTIRPGATELIQVVLSAAKPEPPAAAPALLAPAKACLGHKAKRCGRLAVHVRPRATVLLDGKPLGRTPFEPVDEPAGRHVVELVNDELNARRKLTVQVKRGETTLVDETLE